MIGLFPNAMNPWDCRGHNIINAISLLLCLITTFQYLALAGLYFVYYRRSNNSAWAAIMCVFVLCGFVHGMHFAAVFSPDFAYTAQALMQLILMPTNLWLFTKAPSLFSMSSVHQSVKHCSESTDAVIAAIASLNESEDRVIAIADQLKSQSHYVKQHPWPAWLKDGDSVMLFLNTAYEKWFSVKAETYVGHTDDVAWPAGVANVFREHDQFVRLSETGNVFSETVSIDGSDITLLVIKWPTNMADGSIGVGGMAIPIDALQQMIQKIQHE